MDGHLHPGWPALKDTPANASNRLYKNNRDGTFSDVSAKAGLLDTGWAQGVCVGDYNNDGFEDLFLTYYGQNRLYRNNGDGTFTDVTGNAGLLHPATRYSTGCTFLDYNRDGLLDLFVANYLEIDLATAPKPSLAVPSFLQLPGRSGQLRSRRLPRAKNYLYRNNGDGTFTDVSNESGVAGFADRMDSLPSASMPMKTAGRTSCGVRFDAILVADEQPRRHLCEEGLSRSIAVAGDGQVMAAWALPWATQPGRHTTW